MRKAILLIAVLCFIALGALGFMTAKYVSSYDYKSETLGDGYIINGIRCDKMNYDQAAKKIASEWNGRDILVVGALDEPLATLSGYKCEYDVRDQVARVKKDHPVLTAMNHYLNVPVSVQIPMTVTSCNEEFEDSVKALGFLKRGNTKPTQDAYVDLKDPDFRIVKEVYGNQPDGDRFLEDIIRCIELGQSKFIFKDENYIAMPKVKSDDPKLLEYQKFCRENLHQKITYDLGADSMTISQDELMGMLKDDLSGDADEKAVAKFVEGVAKKYDNVGKKRTFHSLTGKEITVDNATYGWSVDQEGETQQLVEDINSHEDVTREPVWATRGLGKYSLDIGDTYVDIDIENQKLTYFENGKDVFSTDVVTGCRNNGTTTPTGLYSVLNKATNVTLKGRNANGSKYSSFVHYWMAFLGSSYGMHDATWRSQFGGDIWITSGSHGCVNVPPDNMPRLFELVDYNTPVLIYD